ncbi:MAG: hypothetical protein EBR82_63930 [Caulobacteraceae bacterium]|nr:hypothetical protein [Caulobacteraceae bacterium]
MTQIEQESDKLSQAAIPIILKNSSDNAMAVYAKGNSLLGNWVIIMDEKITPGVITMDNTLLSFTPNKDKEYIIKDNVVIATLKNQMFIAIGDKQYDLFKITDNVYSTLNRNITLIKQ